MSDAREPESRFDPSVQDLFGALRACAEDADLLSRFLQDLLTPRGFRNLSTRWAIAEQLLQGLSRKETAARLGVSDHLVGRVARSVRGQDTTGGAAQAHDALKRAFSRSLFTTSQPAGSSIAQPEEARLPDIGKSGSPAELSDASGGTSMSAPIPRGQRLYIVQDLSLLSLVDEDGQKLLSLVFDSESHRSRRLAEKRLRRAAQRWGCEVFDVPHAGGATPSA